MASFTATSSRQIFLSPSAATPRFWTSAWPSSAVERRSQVSGDYLRRGYAITGRADLVRARPGNHPLHVAGAGAGPSRWIPAPICSLLASCSMRWRRESCPFQGQTTAAFFDSLIHSVPEWPLRFNPATPPELERIVRKALEKDPGSAIKARLRCGVICSACGAKWSQDKA